MQVGGGGAAERNHNILPIILHALMSCSIIRNLCFVVGSHPKITGRLHQQKSTKLLCDYFEKNSTHSRRLLLELSSLKSMSRVEI